jgi:hypothetical protein
VRGMPRRTGDGLLHGHHPCRRRARHLHPSVSHAPARGRLQLSERRGSAAAPCLQAGVSALHM